MSNRIVPQLPGLSERIRLFIDSDVANEIDDLYAITLALASPDRFDLRGMIATHFAANEHFGPESTELSFELLAELLELAGHAKAFPYKRGGDPMQYSGVPQPSAGAELLIEQARLANPDEPLWVVVLGAATNTASAILMAPDIAANIRVVFHARCEDLWPERTQQFNVVGDVLAVQSLLNSQTPLVWFDTGTHLTLPYAQSEKRLEPVGQTGAFLHRYRDRAEWLRRDSKGFFDMGDIAWLIDPGLCHSEELPAPALGRTLFFDHKADLGRMLRVSDISVAGAWDLFFDRLGRSVQTGRLR